MMFVVPSSEEFVRGYMAYEQYEPRDAMYKVATSLIDIHWGRPNDMTDALGVLLLTWNQAFYRYGNFNFYDLEKCIERNLAYLETYRARDMISMHESDETRIRELFFDFLDALQIDGGKSNGRKSPVAVSKALHLLAPSFFPLWDVAIAQAYGCHYQHDPVGKYITFFKIIQQVAIQLRNISVTNDKPMTKLIDQYNYAKFTKGWI
ncbi:MAG: hypothetical protein KJ069_25945 [Anaerolineae bacterium]|nr:hypothetical protein [Anaerolineae bacterium]